MKIVIVDKSTLPDYVLVPCFIYY